MSDRNFGEMFAAQMRRGRFVCVGLDSDLAKLPKPFTNRGNRNTGSILQYTFNADIIRATCDIVAAYKPNLAFYPGEVGKIVLRDTITLIHLVAPEVVVILDAKQADIGNTNEGYAAEDFDWYGADAVTVHPFLGAEAMKPFLDRADKGIFVLCRTSNPGAGEFQDLYATCPFVPAEGKLEYEPDPDFIAVMGKGRLRVPLYEYVAYRVSSAWDYNSNCGLVVGATYPDELSKIRKIAPTMPILIPGIGSQGGDLVKSVEAAGDNFLINASRSIIFASAGDDFAQAARAETIKLHQAIESAIASMRSDTND